MKTLRRMTARLALPVAAGLALLAGCGGGDDNGVSGGGNVFGVTPNGSLVRFDKDAPSGIATVGAISGLGGGESVVGLDFRPFNGQLYAVTSANRLYTINTSTAAAAAVGPAFTPGLTGSVAGVDFSPAADRLRIVTASEQNLRVHPESGAVLAIDTNLVYATGDPNAGNTPDVAAAAYTNNANPAPATNTLFVIDTSRDVLARLGGVDGVPSANGGSLVTVGPLGVDAASGPVGFDISGNGTALAVMTVGGARGLYRINLSTGAATQVGPLGADVSEIAITL